MKKEDKILIYKRVQCQLKLAVKKLQDVLIFCDVEIWASHAPTSFLLVRLYKRHRLRKTRKKAWDTLNQIIQLKLQLHSRISRLQQSVEETPEIIVGLTDSALLELRTDMLSLLIDQEIKINLKPIC
jgi:hypothetical protein